MIPQNWTLLVVSSAGDAGLTPVQLQKSLFLIGQALSLKKYYNFTPYSYGPFDGEIYKDAENLETKGYLVISYNNNRSFPTYIITQMGSEFATSLKSQIDKKKSAFVGKLVGYVKSLSFRQLLKIIYNNYPQYAVNSIFRG